MLAHTLSRITGVPSHILADGFSSNRPCVAQIISWAVNRTTTRVEDRAYSLLGLLDVNMPMLYGEGRKAFHRLQLEIIRASNDQSIFAWGYDTDFNGRTGNILADDPSFFRGCHEMKLMDQDKFDDRFGIFPITNRGIQISLPVRSYPDSGSLVEAWLPCRRSPNSGPVSITLALWESEYYRYFVSFPSPTEETLQFRQLYLRYQDTHNRDTTFKIDDIAITEKGFTQCGTYPPELTASTLTLADTRPLCVRVYSDSQANRYLAVAFGQCFGRHWMHFACTSTSDGHSWEDYAREEYKKMLTNGLEHGQSMAEAHSLGEYGDRVWIFQTHLPGSPWTLRTSCITWQSSRIGVWFEVFRYRGFSNTLDVWTDLHVERSSDANRDMRGLMLRRLQAPDGIKASVHAFVHYSCLTRTAGGLRPLR
ncbi:hypothetical protein SCLCIDRAFT_1157965 [Scleroderma citrinum Foug A]|uniref:DUF8212 domain-containing protein n=1 Tax=Scleroderma citrinum Foug A TaxID=1036808 RepID=A0A0C3EBH1_9AGAM|nr:hypothetical protein SCLCIDRAFT_1157965 [Scleroderma citrinum Foug A]